MGEDAGASADEHVALRRLPSAPRLKRPAGLSLNWLFSWRPQPGRRSARYGCSCGSFVEDVVDHLVDQGDDVGVDHVVEDASSVSSSLDPAGQAQLGKMLADPRFGASDGVDQGGDVDLVVGQEPEQMEPTRGATGRLECRSAFVKQCCVVDEGFVALRRRPAEGDAKPPRAALAEDRCGERLRKRRRESRQAGIRKASVSEPLLKHRKTRDGIKTGVCE